MENVDSGGGGVPSRPRGRADCRRGKMRELALRYGCNPHQGDAKAYVEEGALPFEVLNGSPGYINLLDALNAWMLVRELKAATGMPAAASFKHVSPAGAAIGTMPDETEKRVFFVEDVDLSPIAAAYARARGADRLSSFGDWAALSDVVDVPTARILAREVSDGVIAPGYEPEALEILKKKQGGGYRVLQIDPDYTPSGVEVRDVHGVMLQQARNDFVVTRDAFSRERIVTKRKELPDDALLDLIVATVTVKYTQSNSVVLAWRGQAVGVGAGQQSRIHCVRLAAAKADLWHLRFHPRVLELPFKEGVSRAERNNVIDLFLRDDVTSAELRYMYERLDGEPARLDVEEKKRWIEGMSGLSLSSDAFFPFRDSIDRAAASGVEFIAQPGGAHRDAEVIAAADEYGMVMAFTGVRLFHH